MTLSATAALARLVAGNRRFVSGEEAGAGLLDRGRRGALVAGQSPIAVVLGCADSRVPATMIFDQGLGDLFVVRVAGNIVQPALLGSIEYAVGQLGTRLVVVLGHSSCGAVGLALQELVREDPHRSANVSAIVEPMRPTLEPLLTAYAGQDPAALIQHAVRANVRASAAQLRRESSLVAQLIADDGLLVVGAEYDLETGVVDFFDGLPGEQASSGS